MAIALNIATELKRTLDGNDVEGFAITVKQAKESGFDFERTYGKETGFKTILHLALEEDDGEPYVAELLKAGASAVRENPKLGFAPIHAAATEALPDVFDLLISHQADINAVNRDGLTAFHILLSKLIDLANLENRALEKRGANPPSNADIELGILHVFGCIERLVEQKERFNIRSFDSAPNIEAERTSYIKSRATMKKLATMTPLQILCSFQTWNAKPISDNLHEKLASIVSLLLHLGVDPNAAAAKDVLPGTVPGSTPPVMLATIRGYYRVVQVFKENIACNFLIENKFKQTLLHVVLKAGYYNKIVVHGKDSGEVNILTLNTLLDDDNKMVLSQMQAIMNRVDSYGNTAMHYSRSYPDQTLVYTLIRNGARLDKNNQGQLNIQPKTLETYFAEHCIVAEGEDIDDEDFVIRVNFDFFEKSEIDTKIPISEVRQKSEQLQYPKVVRSATVHPSDEENQGAKGFLLEKEPQPSSESGFGLCSRKKKHIPKVETRRLELFAQEDSLHYLLKHPVMLCFLEMELNSIKLRYILDFLVSFLFVIALFYYFDERQAYDSVVKEAIEDAPDVANGSAVQKTDSAILFEESDTSVNFAITYAYIYMILMVLLLTGREILQAYRTGKRYFITIENYIEWFVLLLVIFILIPWDYVKVPSDKVKDCCMKNVFDEHAKNKSHTADGKLNETLYKEMIADSDLEADYMKRYYKWELCKEYQCYLDEIDTLFPSKQFIRHLSAITILIAFMQLYVMLVRIVPQTPIPVYINMFTTVLKTYTLILLSYFVFIAAFGYSFYIIFNPDKNAFNVEKLLSREKKQEVISLVLPDNTTATLNGAEGAQETNINLTLTDTKMTTEEKEEEASLFRNLWLSMIKTMVMFIGEFDYASLQFSHELGYVVFVLFVFLLVIVLLNILNGLAVSDIHKIREEVDSYYHISIVETLSLTKYVPLLSRNVVLKPNIRAENQKLFYVPIPTTKVYRSENSGPTKSVTFFFSDKAIKSTKELVAQKLLKSSEQKQITLENISEAVVDLMREQINIRRRLNDLEENIKTVLGVVLKKSADASSSQAPPTAAPAADQSSAAVPDASA